MPLIVGYILIIISFSFLAFHGVTFFLSKWEEVQKKKADQSTSQFEEMFIFLRKEVFVALYIIIPLALGVLAFIFSRQLWVGLIFMLVGAFIPLYLVKMMDKIRRAKFNQQLPDGLMIMSSCLKGGLTLIQAFEILAEEMTPPISQEISLLVREIKVGVSLEEGLIRLGKRMPSEEMILIISAILVARETGGNLTHVFSRLITTIRDRAKLRDMILTLTLQSRLQSFLISLLGPAFVVIVYKINPHHFDVMWQNELGRMMLIIAIVLQIVGIVLIIIFGKIEI